MHQIINLSTVAKKNTVKFNFTLILRGNNKENWMQLKNMPPFCFKTLHGGRIVSSLSTRLLKFSTTDVGIRILRFNLVIFKTGKSKPSVIRLKINKKLSEV